MCSLNLRDVSVLARNRNARDDGWQGSVRVCRGAAWLVKIRTIIIGITPIKLSLVADFSCKLRTRLSLTS